MKIQHRIAFAQLPALLMLVVLSFLGQGGITRLGEAAERILADNYQSVISVNRVREAAFHIDEAALIDLAGRRDDAAALVAQWSPVLDEELRAEEDNITELGEAEAVSDLRAAWRRSQASFAEFRQAPEADRAALYFEALHPALQQVAAHSDRVLALNHDAMMKKSDRASAEASRLRRLGALAGLGGIFAAGLVGIWVAARLGEPYQRLSTAAERVAAGDLDTHLRESGDEESIQVARAFNRMIAKLREYRRATQTEVTRAQGAAQAAINSLPEPVLVLAGGGALRLANQAAETLLGLPAGASSIGGLQGELRHRIQALVSAVEQDGVARIPTDYGGVLTVATAEGERAWLPHAVPMLDPLGGGLVGVTVLLQDVTRLRRLDQLKGDLVHTVAHELRTPLTSLGMALHLALDPRVSGPLPDALTELLSAAREDLRRLKTLVEDLLDLSRIQEGRLALRRDTFGAAELLTDVAATWASAAALEGNPMHIDADSASLSGDRARLAVAVGNLVANALRASPPGGEIRLLAARVDDEALGPRLRLAVEDAGPGVPEEDRERFFQRFERGAAGGAGLGLYIAREIVLAHGGTCGIEVGSLGGARVWLELPVGGGEGAPRGDPTALERGLPPEPRPA